MRPTKKIKIKDELRLILALLLFWSPAAFAQQFDQPNPFISIDGNGVDLATGEYNFPSLSVSLGGDGSALPYEEVLGRDPYSGYIEIEDQQPYITTRISYGNSSFVFAHGTYNEVISYSSAPKHTFHPSESYSQSTYDMGDFPFSIQTYSIWVKGDSYSGPSPDLGQTVNVVSQCGQIYTEEGVEKCWNVKITTWYTNIKTVYRSREPYSDGRYDQLSGPVAYVKPGSLYGEYTLTLASGESAYYKDQILRKIKKQNGEVIDIEHYLNEQGKPVTRASLSSVRYYSYSNKYSSGQMLVPSYVTRAIKRSVRSSSGWALKFNVDTSNDLTKVVGWNRSMDYCDTASTCADTLSNAQASDYRNMDGYKWVYLNGVRGTGYAKALGSINVTSPLGKTKNFVKEVISISGTQHELRLNSVTVDGKLWDYDYVDIASNVINGNYTLSRKDPLNKVFQLKYGFYGPDHTIDELNRKTTVLYDGYKIKDVISPKGTMTTGASGYYPGSTRNSYDSRGNITSVRSVSSDDAEAGFIQSAGYPQSCDEATAKFCNKPEWVRDARGNLPENINNVDYRTDYTYSTDHGGVLTEKLPPNEQNVRLMTRYDYEPLYAKIKNSSGTLVNAEGPIYKLSKVSSCASAQTLCDQAGDTVTEYEYEHPNLLMTATIVRSGNNTVSATTLYEYDYVGNTTAVDGPLAGTVDKAYTTYDVLRRKVFEIGPDPDGDGPLKRQIVRHKYDADGLETRTESGTVNDSNGPAFSYAAFNIANPDLAPYTWATAKNMYYDGAAQLIKTEVVVP